MNNVQLLGRLTKDPELKYTQSGKGYARFTLAVNRNEKQSDFINCVAWNKTAELIAEYLRKGHRLLVEGNIVTGSYEDKETKKKVYTTDVWVGKIHFVENNKKENIQSKTEVEDTVEEFSDEDFPF